MQESEARGLEVGFQEGSRGAGGRRAKSRVGLEEPQVVCV